MPRKGKTRPKSATQRAKLRNRRAALASVLTLAGFLLLAVLLAMPPVADVLERITGILPQEQVPLPGGAAPGTAVHVLDIGQGNAVLLQCGGEYALVDAGVTESADTLLAYLSDAGVQRLRYLVMTHPHADHIGAMQDVVEHVAVDEVLVPDFNKGPMPTTALFEHLLEAFVRHDLPLHTMRTDERFPLGEGELVVLHEGLDTDDNLNEICPVLLFESGGFRFINTGDGEKANEVAVLETGADVRCQLLLAGHHGSHTSSIPAFIEAASPDIAIISCGRDNSYGHPHQSTLDTLGRERAEILRTDQMGHIVVYPDENGRLVARTSADADDAALPPAA